MRGFTLIEVMLSVAMITLIAGISIPVYQSFQTRNDLDIAANALAHSLRRAQTLARASDGDSPWGVSVQTESITLFKGASFSARDSTFDEMFSMPENIAPTGAKEIVFAKFTGFPLSGGVFTLTSYADDVRNIAVNAKGMVSD